MLVHTAASSSTPAEQAAVITETRSIPHVADALFNYTTHEIGAFLKYLRNAHDLPDGGAIPFGVLAAAIEKEHDYRIGQLQEAHGRAAYEGREAVELQRCRLQAKVEALQTGTIAGAGLDVFAEEPTVHPGLLALTNCVLNPHLGSATIETRTAMGLKVVENLVEVGTNALFVFLLGGPAAGPARRPGRGV